ncbi:MAG: hypothetical protein GIX03_00180 [Candidatus Eremiobacteraeota bacterium]|nr:hypothetical protein [Candidatus Eremiobacteraeota bacterium]MBC5801440.1 hypothetical protein [Candidatus Eremiobacteraeota bacterium]MBC5821194.1 hypothetical protein [Candidatus Eremiobacteraeota bacterium]
MASSGRRRALLAVRSRNATRGRGVCTTGGTTRGVAVRRATGAAVRIGRTVGRAGTGGAVGTVVVAVSGAAVAGTGVGTDRESSRTISLFCARCSWLTVYVCSVAEPPESVGCSAATTISSATIK